LRLASEIQMPAHLAARSVRVLGSHGLVDLSMHLGGLLQICGAPDGEPPCFEDEL
jgi:hypothetical protein